MYKLVDNYNNIFTHLKNEIPTFNGVSVRWHKKEVMPEEAGGSPYISFLIDAEKDEGGIYGIVNFIFIISCVAKNNEMDTLINFVHLVKEVQNKDSNFNGNCIYSAIDEINYVSHQPNVFAVIQLTTHILK